jgi:hypothetical protein
MFYTDNNAYSWYPNKEELEILKQKGYKIAVFKSHSGQELPEYILEDKDILIIDKKLR